MMDDKLLTDIAERIGAPYLMTGEQILTHLIMGDRRHDDASADVCGAIDPRDPQERHWCMRPLGHDGNHNRYL